MTALLAYVEHHPVWTLIWVIAGLCALDTIVDAFRRRP